MVNRRNPHWSSWSTITWLIMLAYRTFTVDHTFHGRPYLSFGVKAFLGRVFHPSFTVITFSTFPLPCSHSISFNLLWIMPMKRKAFEIPTPLNSPTKYEMFTIPDSRVDLWQSIHQNQGCSWPFCQALPRCPRSLLFAYPFRLSLLPFHFWGLLRTSCQPFLLNLCFQ